MKRTWIKGWSDASFRQDKERYIGSGAILATTKKNRPLILLAFNLNALDIKTSQHAEFWGSLLVTKMVNRINGDTIPKDTRLNLCRIYTDNTSVSSWFDYFEEKGKTSQTIPHSLKKKFNRFRGPHLALHIKHKSRENEFMKIADRLAYHGARGNKTELEKLVKRHQLSCAYSVVTPGGDLNTELIVFDEGTPS